jgi:sugar phosphate isomerase/epimerase
MSRADHQDIRIGTLAEMGKALTYLPEILPHGFESFQLTNWREISVTDLEEHGKKVRDLIAGKAVIGAIGVYGNPLQEEVTAQAFEKLIKNAKHFGTTVVCGFAGALEDRPIDQSMAKFKEVFSHLAKVAEDEGVKIGFENCDMGGTWQHPAWNIAHSPRAWEMMFNEVPSHALGLEWEPCHQMLSLIDPLPQLKKWVHKVHHIHGKDATVDYEKLKTEGIRSGEWIVWHRTPGFGDTNWTDLISILRRANWKGSIDIEGWHDPIYKDDLEMTGQVHALRYLQNCRGGAYVPPVA